MSEVAISEDRSVSELDRLAGLAEDVIRRARAAGASQAEVAASIDTGTNEERTYDERTVFGEDTFTVEKALADRGVNAERVEQWGNKVRAFVIQPDGKLAMQFFDRDSLQTAN